MELVNMDLERFCHPKFETCSEHGPRLNESYSHFAKAAVVAVGAWRSHPFHPIQAVPLHDPVCPSGLLRLHSDLCVYLRVASTTSWHSPVTNTLHPVQICVN